MMQEILQTSKIGLLSGVEAIAYKDIISNLSESWWTRSVSIVKPDGSVDPYSIQPNEFYAVRPALYVDPDVLVFGGNGGTVQEGAKASTLTKLSAMKAGAQVNFAGYTWIILDPDKDY